MGGPIRTFSDVSEVSKDCNLTFEHSFPGVVLYSNWEQRALCSRETGFVVLEATVLCVGKGQTLQFPLETCDGTSVFCFRNIPETNSVYKQAGGSAFLRQIS